MVDCSTGSIDQPIAIPTPRQTEPVRILPQFGADQVALAEVDPASRLNSCEVDLGLLTERPEKLRSLHIPLTPSFRYSPTFAGGLRPWISRGFSGLLAIGAVAVLPMLLLGAAGITELGNLDLVDLRGRSLGADHFKARVTIISLARYSTRERAEQVAGQLGARYSRMPGFQELIVSNTTDVPGFLRSLVASHLRAAEQGAITDAYASELRLGVPGASRESVGRKLLFVDDPSGQTWIRLGMPPGVDEYAVGVADVEGRLVYLAREPIDMAALDELLAREFSKVPGVSEESKGLGPRR